MESCTEGAVSIELFLNGILGPPRNNLTDVAQGALDLAIVPSQSLESTFKGIAALSIPFVFNNRRHWEVSLAGGAIDQLKEQIETSSNVRLLGFLGGEQFGLLSNSPILTLEDMQDRTFVTFGNFGQVFSAFGAQPVDMAFAEIFSGLSTGKIDASESTANLALMNKTFEAANDFTRTNHRIVTEFLIMNSNAFNNLSENQANCVLASAETATGYGKQAVINAEDAALSELSEAGIAIHSISDRELMFEMAKGLRNEYFFELEAAPVLEAIAAFIDCPNWCEMDTCDDTQCELCSFCE